MEEEQQDGLRLSDIFSVVWKRIAWILIISVIAALVCAMVVQYSISPSKENYSLSFRIAYPNEDVNSDKLLYPDETSFRLETMVYADRLNKAKESDEAFEKIDTDSMAARKNISLASNPNGSYTVTVAAFYFKSTEEASKFLKAVLEVARQEYIQNVEEIEHYGALVEYGSALTVADKLSVLQSRQEALLDTYTRYLAKYADFADENGNTLQDCYVEAKDTANFIHLGELEQKWAANEAIIQSLEGVATEADAYVEAVAENAEIEYELKQIYAALEYTGATGAYLDSEKLAALKTEVDTQTETLGGLISALYKSKTKFAPHPDNILVTGGMNPIKYSLVVFVVAFVVASVVFCVVDLTRKRKNPAAAAEQEEMLSPQEVQAEEGSETEEQETREEVKEEAEEPNKSQEEKPKKKKAKKD